MVAILFDLDETLLDRSNSLERFLLDQYNRYWLNFQRIPYATFRHRFLELDKRGYVHKSIVYRTLLDEFAIKDLTMEELLSDYNNTCCQHAKAFSGMHDVLTKLREWGCKLGVVTNGETNFQQRHIDVLGLPLLVDTILISEQEGLRKPDPRIFALAAKRLHVTSDACLFVGDNPTADIIGAHSVGMRTAWFPNGRSWPEDLLTTPDYVIAALADLLNIAVTWRVEANIHDLYVSHSKSH